MLTERPSRAPIAFARRYETAPAEEAPVTATLATRFAAFVVDWTICVVIINALVGSLALLDLPAAAMLVASAAMLVAYYTVFWARGRTPGMRVMGIVAVDPDSGAPPTMKCALYRALLTVPSGAAAVVLGLYLYAAALGVDPADATGALAAWRALALLGITLPYLIAAIHALRDPERRMLHDRIARIIIIEGTPKAS